jgi:predicted regulator of amino acid metabolism with ACT domain
LTYSSDLGRAVREFIERDGAIRRDLERGLINIRALARLFLEESGYDASLEAVVSAIRRCEIRGGAGRLVKPGRFITKLSMRNKIADVALVNHPDVHRSIWQVASKIDFARGEVFRMVAGVQAIRLIMDEKNLNLVERLPRDKVIKVTRGLAEIIIALPPEAERTPGVVSGITTELALQGINMIEIMSCVPEIVIVVEEADAVRSFEVLDRLSQAK